MTRHESDGRCVSPISDGDSRIGGHSHSGRDAGDDLEGNSVPGEVLGLLGSATEDQGVASLEPDDDTACPDMLKQERIDLILMECAMPTGLAGTDPDRLGRSQVEQPGAGEMIVNHHIGPAHRIRPAQRQEAGVSRPCAHEIHDSGS